MSQAVIESTLKEERLFNPPSEFANKAHIKSFADYQKLYEYAKTEPEKFWAELAEKELHWFRKWDQVLDWQPPFAKWFVGGKLNISYNCLDRHLKDQGDKTALIWEGEPGDVRTFTYAQLHEEVCMMANVLKQLGIKKGDRIGIYLPMIPEAVIAMLACARIGAPHTVVFGGFSAEALKGRLLDAEAKLVITADGGWRKDAIIPLKEQVDKALEDNLVPSVKNVLVVKRTAQPVSMKGGRDLWWEELKLQASTDFPPEEMDSEDILFILYLKNVKKRTPVKIFLRKNTH
jgi:acetyl-CoA synthetase